MRALGIAGAALLASLLTPLTIAAGVTVDASGADAYVQPIAGLDADQQRRFARGFVGFNARWVVFPSLGGEWGLGPVFLAERCSDCHVNGGRGPREFPGKPLVRTLVRVSVPGKGTHGGPLPHPVYGDQLQTRGLMGEDPRAHGYGERVRPEARVAIDWREHDETLDDGTVVHLRQPKIKFDHLEYGPLGDDALKGLRYTPPLHGLGLLEAVAESDLLAIATAQAARPHRDGYRPYAGRPNRVHDIASGEMHIGRFGWKANQPNLRQQLAVAFHGDIGVTSSLFPEENCTEVQVDCSLQPPGNSPEVIDTDLANLALWSATLAAPSARSEGEAQVERGRAVFDALECSLCHVPSLRTADDAQPAQLAGQAFHPYTDLLLHDMGEGLADGRPDFAASGSDWRTPPLWGIGLSITVNNARAFLHDGRARTLTEAVMWHGGEAAWSRDAFRAISRDDRTALLAFLESI